LSAFLSPLKKEQGQALVETALVFAFILIPVLFGIIQFGIIFNGQMTVTSAAREGARMAVVGKSNAQVKEHIINYVNNRPESLFIVPINENNIKIIPARDEERVDGGNIDITVTAETKVVVPVLNYIVGETVSVASRAVMRIEVLP